jgi:aerobic carbon-monoxide dehydrogenase medium subunit
MITAEFEYESPRTLEQVFSLLANGRDDTKILAGGMTLVPMLNLGLLAPARIISLRNVLELHEISEREDALVIGAMTRHQAVATEPRVEATAPVLAMAARLIGDVQVRNRGTLGGSLAHADPAANYLPAILLLNAEFNLAGPSASRRVPAIEFFRDAMTTLLDTDELIVSVEIRKRAVSIGYGFRKFTRVKGNFPIVCTAALWDDQLNAGKIVVGGVTATPTIIEVTRELENDRSEMAEAIGQAIVDPLEDLNGDAEYKREIAVVMAGRALADAISDSNRGRRT